MGNGKISKREYEIVADRDVMIPVRDGIKIASDIFRPNSKGKFPALVATMPFNKEVQSQRIWPGASKVAALTAHRMQLLKPVLTISSYAEAT